MEFKFLCEFIPWQRGLHPLDSVLELRDVSAELLPQSERGGVLRVGATDLDDVGILLSLSVKGVLQLLKPWDEDLVDVHGDGDVHGSRVGVVGALGLVDVVIGVHRDL